MTSTTPQEYVDEEIARHEAALEHAPIVEGLLVHGRAIAELRAVRRRQHRPRLIVPAHLTVDLAQQLAEQPLAMPDALEHVLEVASHPERLEWHDAPAPATSPIYAQLRKLRGWGTSSP